MQPIISATLRRVGMATLVATLSAGLFTSAAIAAPQQRASTNAPNTSPCVSPPADFNPLAASDTQLLYYGLPRRPSDSSAYFGQWVMVVTHAKTRGCVDHIGPRTFLRRHPISNQLGPQVGYNWSGWVATSSTFYAVSGQWQIPCINTGQSPSGSGMSDWVGIGGDSTNTLLQTGTIWDHTSRSWKSFYEEVTVGSPGSPTEFASVNCGDNMFGEVDYGQTYVSQSYYFVQDVTTGAYWTNHNYFAPGFSSAEWIEESGSCTGSQWRQLANFGHVNWSYAGAGLSYSSEQVISHWGTKQYYSTASLSDHTHTADAQSLGSGGNNFTDKWAQNGKNYC